MSQENFITNFEDYLKQCISVVAVMRLVVDPFPILLMDEEFLYRCFNSVTDPYSEEFVDEYIGSDIVNAYRTTGVYRDTYELVMKNERKNEAVFNVTKHRIIDSRKMDEILPQLSLMTRDDIICTLLVHNCDKIVKVYCQDGFLMYFTEKNTNRTAMSWSGADFKRFSESEIGINQSYDQAYVSVFRFDNESFFAEHNEKFVEGDIARITELVLDALSEINGLSTE